LEIIFLVSSRKEHTQNLQTKKNARKSGAENLNQVLENLLIHSVISAGEQTPFMWINKSGI
jgi:hypothetical protein